MACKGGWNPNWDDPPSGKSKAPFAKKSLSKAGRGIWGGGLWWVNAHRMLNEISTKSPFSPYFIRGHLSPYFIRGQLLLKQKNSNKKKINVKCWGVDPFHFWTKKRLGEVANLLRRKHMHNGPRRKKHFMNGERRRGKESWAPTRWFCWWPFWDGGVTWPVKWFLATWLPRESKGHFGSLGSYIIYICFKKEPWNWSLHHLGFEENSMLSPSFVKSVRKV